MSMDLPDDFAEFFGQHRATLLKFLAGGGACLSDAEDAAQTAFTGMLASLTNVEKPRAYLYQAGKNEVTALAKRQRRDLDTARRSMDNRVERSADEGVYHHDEVTIVRASLAILPPRQREVMARAYAGYRISDIAESLGISTSTVRSNLRHGRTTLRSVDRQDLQRRAGQRLYEAWQRGDPLPISPRPVIRRAWRQSKALGVDPLHGSAVLPLGRDEVTRRRSASPLAACAWALDALTELGKTTGQMMVVVDAEGVVLWRGGDREVLRLTDVLGFVEGACWDIRNAGANGIALALTTGRAVTVCGWEHYVQDQHNLS